MCQLEHVHDYYTNCCQNLFLFISMHHAVIVFIFFIAEVSRGIGQVFPDSIMKSVPKHTDVRVLTRTMQN